MCLVLTCWMNAQFSNVKSNDTSESTICGSHSYADLPCQCLVLVALFITDVSDCFDVKISIMLIMILQYEQK